MAVIMDYPITKKHISRNYTKGSNIINNLRFMVIHSTATPGATDEAEFTYFNSGDRHASAHTFIDWDSITELVVVEPNKVECAWHAGNTANYHAIGVEMCEPASHDPAKFNKVWKRSVWYFAYKMITVLKKTTVDKTNLMSHKEVSDTWHESDHQDPVSFLAKYGKTVDQFRAEVQAKINQMIGTSAPVTTGKQYGVVNASELNLRAQPNTNCAVVKTYKNGDKVEILGTTSGWYKVSMSDGKTGYMSAQYIKITAAPAPAPVASKQYGVINASELNLRAQANTNCAVIKTYKKSARVEIIGTTTGWYKVVTDDGKTGYMSAQYIRKV